MAKRMAKQMELFEPVERGFDEGGLMDEGGMVDEESGNEVPPGSLREEVRDDIPAQLSEGEFVFPADVVRYFGLEKLMEMRQEAKAGLAQMEAMGQMGNSDEATLPDDIPFDVEDLEVDNEEDDLEFQVGGYVPGMYQRPMMQPQAYSPYGQQPPSVFRPQPSYVQPSFTYTPDKSNLPTFQQTIGPGVPYVDFEYVEYVNDSGQIVRLRRSKTTGKLLDPVPAGFRPKSQKVTVETTQVTKPREDNDGGGDGPSSPSSASTSVGGLGMNTKSSAYNSAVATLGLNQLGSLSPMAALASHIGGIANPNTKATMGNLARQTALDVLGYKSVDQATPSQLDAVGYAMQASMNLADNVKSSTPAEIAKSAATISSSLVGAHQNGTLSLDQMKDIANVEIDSTTGAWKDQKAVAAYVDAILSVELQDIEKGLVGTSKERGITSAEKAARQSAEIEAAIADGSYGLGKDDPEDRGGPPGGTPGSGEPGTGAKGTGGLGPGGGGGSISGGGTVGEAPGMGNMGEDTSGEEPDGDNSNSGNTGNDTSGEDPTGGDPGPGSGNDGSDNDGSDNDGSDNDGPGTYICTASYANGLIAHDHFTSLKKYGIMLRRNDPYLMKAYDWFGPALASAVKTNGIVSLGAKFLTSYYDDKFNNKKLSASQKAFDVISTKVLRPIYRIIGWTLTKIGK